MNAIKIKSLADVRKIEQAQAFEELMPFETTYEAIKAGASLSPHKVAISFFLSGDQFDKPTNISYKTLIENITKTANFFHFLGLDSNDVVAFILPNLPETHYVMWGGEAACQVLAINPLLEPNQIKDLINSAGAKAVVTMNPMTNIDLWPKLESILPELDNVKHVIGVDVAHYVPGLKGLAASAIQTFNRIKIAVPAGKQYHHFQSAIKRETAFCLIFQRAISDRTVSSLFCTGGTTGLPKIARRTHHNELANSLSVQLANGDLLSKDKVILGGLPLFHVNGALVTGLVPFSIGATVVMATPQGYRGENVISKFWDIVGYHRVSAFSGVPTVYSALMSFPTEGKDLSSLELGICGAAPMPVETFKSFQQKTGIKILEGYGCTEGTCVSSLNPFHGEQKIGSIGIRIPYQEMMSVKIENDKIIAECKTDEIGTLVVKGPNVFLGYQLDHQNKGVFVTDENGEKWLNTGDLARQDEDGYFWLTGRKKELIVRGGHN
ncbi:MAG: AMP-binding protein, partial [Pseudomonadales bacterium]|nr:AMP-binding protein [Pseudomonadales bacterium]